MHLPCASLPFACWSMCLPSANDEKYDFYHVPSTICLRPKLCSVVKPAIVQGWAKRRSPGFVNFFPAVAYHFCLALPAAFTQPRDHFSAEPCTKPCQTVWLFVYLLATPFEDLPFAGSFLPLSFTLNACLILSWMVCFEKEVRLSLVLGRFCLPEIMNWFMLAIQVQQQHILGIRFILT